jgi:hypothetical protein
MALSDFVKRRAQDAIADIGNLMKEAHADIAGTYQAVLFNGAGLGTPGLHGRLHYAMGENLDNSSLEKDNEPEPLQETSPELERE